jgi:putative oxidoreductase
MVEDAMTTREGAMSSKEGFLNRIIQNLTGGTEGRAQLLIRLSVGLIFFTQGILKFTDPHMGVLRFTKIGFPYPGFTAHFVGTFEILCGFLVLVGLWTRLGSIPLLIINLTAIATTKIPELSRPEQGFWFMVSDARTDFAMLMGLLFLLVAGAGSLSVDASRASNRGASPDANAPST